MTTNTLEACASWAPCERRTARASFVSRTGFDTDMDDLWSALTDPHRLARWIGEVEDDLRQGGEFRAHYFASGWEGTGRVEVCEPPHRPLILTKSLDEPDGVIEPKLTADCERCDARARWHAPRLPTAGRNIT